jgi:acetolactate synthase I/II/III large subunit
MKKIKISNYIFKTLNQHGVNFVPVYPSGNALHLIDGVGNQKKIKAFVNYHEQASGLAAEAYGRFKKLGACCVGAGPAATNLSTAIMSAYCDSIPVVFVTGQVGMFHKKHPKIRQRGFQEVDVAEHMKPITKYSVLVKKKENIRYELEKAIFLALDGRPGPVVLDIPYNVQLAYVDASKLKSYKPPKKPKKNYRNYFKTILKNISKSKKPVILLGGGLNCAKLRNKNDLFRILEKLNIPVCTTWAATDLLYFDYPLNLGDVGRGGKRSAVYAVQESDLLITFGTRFTPKIVIDEKKFANKAKIISVDIDMAEMTHALVKVDYKIKADLSDFIPQFNNFLKKYPKLTLNKSWNERVKELKDKFYIVDETINLGKNVNKYISPYKFITELYNTADASAIFIPDAGMNDNWTYQANRLKKGQRLFTGFGAGPMGYSLPAGIGAFYATKSNQIIVIAGDGGFQMNIQELEAISFHKIPIKIFILNNECLGNTKFPVLKMFKNTLGNDKKGGYSWPDFCEVAKAYKIEGHEVNSKTKLKSFLNKILKSKKPSLTNVKISPNQFMLETGI